MDERSVLRKEMLLARDRLSPPQRVEKSRAILNQLWEITAFAQARIVCQYVHFRSEVQTMDLLQRLRVAGREVCVPLTLLSPPGLLAIAITDPETQLVPGYAGIAEPTSEQAARAVVDPESIDVILIPGSVFDRKGGRLGYGGGYYDRFLAGGAQRAVRIALAYELQVVDNVPMKAYDQLMDYLVTEQAVYFCGRRSYAQNGNI